MLDINIRGGGMTKYTEQAKLAAVQDYCSGNGGLRDVARRHNVNFSSLRQWVLGYQTLGITGITGKKKIHYSPAFKLSVLQRMREEKLSYRQAAALFDIRRFDILGQWERRYDEGGLEALSRQPGSGPHKKMTNPVPSIPLESSGDEAHTRDDLLSELNQLRMEIAYLKKLDALVQAKERAAQRKKHKS
jgi:transposase